MEEDGLSTIQKKYDMYKEANIRFLRFNPEEKTSCNKLTFSRSHLNPQVFACFISAAREEHAPLEAVYIFFDTATYNEIERDVKVRNLF